MHGLTFGPLDHCLSPWHESLPFYSVPQRTSLGELFIQGHINVFILSFQALLCASDILLLQKPILALCGWGRVCEVGYVFVSSLATQCEGGVIC